MSRSYTPRRQSKRWLDGDCPDGVLAIYDSKNSGERYTIFYRVPLAGTDYASTVLEYVGCSGAPFHPQGVGMHGEMGAWEVASYRYRCKHQAATWSSLPDDVKKLVRQDLKGDE